VPLTTGSTRVKEARKLSRRSVRTERRLFLADGPKAVEGALGRPGCVAEVFATPEATQRYAALADLAATAGAGWVLVDERALASLSDSVTPAGVVAVCHALDRPLADLLEAAPRLVAVCADVRDPGNAGTVVRCADAAGADLVVLAGTSVDAYNPKTVRASVGSLFHVPLAVEPDAVATIATLRAAGLTVLATAGDGEAGLYEVDLDGPTAWLFGNEAHGLRADLAALADHRVAIPIHGRAESLNLSTAAALCLYESARRRTLPT
jgi:TrmH family RNA methyltransferase